MAVVLSGAFQASASLYDISFTGFDANTTATGQIEVNAGIASSGFLDVTHNGITIDYAFLAEVGVLVKNNNGDHLSGQDNVFNPNSLTQGGFLTQNGLIFYNGTQGDYDHAGGGMFLQNWPNNEPNLQGYGKSPAGYGYDAPFTDGTLTVTAVTAVPESGTWMAGALLLLPFGASAIRLIRKQNKLLV